RAARTALYGELGGCPFPLELSHVTADAVVEKVDYRTNPWTVADTLVGHQPHRPAMVVARRDALDQVELAVGNDAGQHGNPQAGTDGRHHAHRRGVVHDHPVVEPEVMQPGRIGAP